jgi:formyl-CoA transferase
MLDVAISALTSAVAPALQGMKFKRLGNRHWGACPTNIYPARDGEILIFCLTEGHWRTLAQLMCREDLIADPRCKSHGTRLKIADELDALVSDWTREQKRDAIVQRLIEAGIPCAPVRNIDEVIADPEVTERRTLIDSDYPTRGAIKVAGTPIKLSVAQDSSRPMRRPPALGEHNAEVLASIGIDASQLEILKRNGVV